MTRSVRATEEERRRPLPGDGLIADPRGTLTYAVTIDRPRRDVWPWIVQMGAGERAGWYSYDLLDNGCHRSADCIVPALQHISPGTLFPALPGETEGFHVVQAEPERQLVLAWLPPPAHAPLVAWAFVLEDVDSERTRLIARARAGRDYRFHGLLAALGLPVVRLVHFVMQRKQLLGIATRAEHAMSLSDPSTAQRACRTTSSDTLPTRSRSRRDRPCEPTTMRSADHRSAAARIASRGSPSRATSLVASNPSVRKRPAARST